MVEDVINGNQNFAMPQIPNRDQNKDLIQQHQQQAKRLSHNGYFFNNSNIAEKSKTSAIVPPFNHSPTPTPPPHPSVQQQRQQHQQNLQTMVQNSSALRRNDSY